MQETPSAFKQWFEALKPYSGFPAKGTMAGALVVLERLKESFDLKIGAHMAGGGAQIKGASGAAVRKILSRFGETRPLASEGGRTNRGLPGEIKAMLAALGTLGLEQCPAGERTTVLESCQAFLVEQVREFHSRTRIELKYDPTCTTRELIRQLLETAKERRQSGQVAQYLVGAKLALRFPGIEVPNESYSTADQQLGRPGDFVLGDTSFHVTMAPMEGVYERCARNVAAGLRVFLLVPDEHVQSARALAKEHVPGRVAVESIESFVGQNVEEMAAFSHDELTLRFLQLLDAYNKRVDAIEADKAVMIEIPDNLARHRKDLDRVVKGPRDQ